MEQVIKIRNVNLPTLQFLQMQWAMQFSRANSFLPIGDDKPSKIMRDGEPLLSFLQYWYGDREIYYLFLITKKSQERSFDLTPLLTEGITMLKKKEDSGMIYVFSITKSQAAHFRNGIDFSFHKTYLTVRSEALRDAFQRRIIMTLTPSSASQFQVSIPYLLSYDLKQKAKTQLIAPLLALLHPNNHVGAKGQGQFRQLQMRKQQILQRSSAPDAGRETHVKIFIATGTNNDAYRIQQMADVSIGPDSSALLSLLVSIIPGIKNALKKGDSDAIAFLHYTRVILRKYPSANVKLREGTFTLLTLLKYLATHNFVLRPIIYIHIIPESILMSKHWLQSEQELSFILNKDDWIELEGLIEEEGKNIASGNFGTVWGPFSAEQIQEKMPDMEGLDPDFEYVLKVQSIRSPQMKADIVATQATMLKIGEIIDRAPRAIQQRFHAHFIIPLDFIWNKSETTCIEVQRFGGKDVFESLTTVFTLENHATFLKSVIAILQCGFYLIDKGGYYLSDIKIENTVIDDHDFTLSLIDLVFNPLGRPVISTTKSHTVPLQYIMEYYPYLLQSYKASFQSQEMKYARRRISQGQRDYITRYPGHVPAVKDPRLIAKFTLVYSLFFILFFLLPEQQVAYRQRLSELFRFVLEKRTATDWKAFFTRINALLRSLTMSSISQRQQQQQQQA